MDWGALVSASAKWERGCTPGTGIYNMAMRDVKCADVDSVSFYMHACALSTHFIRGPTIKYRWALVWKPNPLD